VALDSSIRGRVVVEVSPIIVYPDNKLIMLLTFQKHFTIAVLCPNLKEQFLLME